MGLKQGSCFFSEVCKRRLSKGVFLHRWLKWGDVEKGSLMGTLRDSFLFGELFHYRLRETRIRRLWKQAPVLAGFHQGNMEETLLYQGLLCER